MSTKVKSEAADPGEAKNSPSSSKKIDDLAEDISKTSLNNSNSEKDKTNSSLSDSENNNATASPNKSGKEDQEENDDDRKGEGYQECINHGLNPRVAAKLNSIFKTGRILPSHFDDRAWEAIKELPVDFAFGVIEQFTESNLNHVQNKSAFLCGVMKTYRERSKAGQLNGAGGGLSGRGDGDKNDSSSSALASDAKAKGPDESKLNAILERTGYTLDVTTGQRKYGGPPPDWEGTPPGQGCEVFCGKIPRDIYEDELIPLFEKCGRIWDLRLMMDPMTGLNRGYAFVTFADREGAAEAVKQLDSYVIAEDKSLKVNVSDPKTRLFIGNIPKSKGRNEIFDEFNNLSAGLREVIIYSSPDDKKKNRGFCFLEYESHKDASLAKRRLETGRVKVWSCDIIVDWADPQEEPDLDTMQTVKVLYVRNLTASVTEEKLREIFEAHGKIERVKKIKDYAFVHFDDRQHALAAMKALNDVDVAGGKIEISLAKPPSDKKKKEEVLRKREQRMMKSMSQNMAPLPFLPFPPAGYPIPHQFPAMFAAAHAVSANPSAGGRGAPNARGGGHLGGASPGGRPTALPAGPGIAMIPPANYYMYNWGWGAAGHPPAGGHHHGGAWIPGGQQNRPQNANMSTAGGWIGGQQQGGGVQQDNNWNAGHHHRGNQSSHWNNGNNPSNGQAGGGGGQSYHHHQSNGNYRGGFRRGQEQGGRMNRGGHHNQ